MDDRIDVDNALSTLRAYCEKEDFAGWDPYDALNSPFMPLLSLGTKYGRIAWTQFLRRSPVNLRPLLCIPKGHNPKALGLFLSGFAKLYELEKDMVYLARCRELIDRLKGCRSNGRSGSCWGYNFPWQSRVFYIPAGTPTIVNSSFIGHALMDAAKLPGLEDASELAHSIGDFILNDLNRQNGDNEICFSYTPLDRYFVHNANLLGAAMLARLYKESGRTDMLEPALAALNYSMRRQRPNGSWFYSEWEGAHWIDSYHTGFNLQAIKYFLDSGLADECREPFDRGVRFYKQHCFLPDGTPKYYHDRIYPIDIHSPAQAVAFFSGLGAPYKEFIDRVLVWMMGNMQSEKGYFHFQKQKHYTVRIPYMRWSQAWAFHALTSYCFNVRERENG